MSDGKFVPEWMYKDAEKQGYSAGLEERDGALQQLSVTVNNERYSIIWIRKYFGLIKLFTKVQ